MYVPPKANKRAWRTSTTTLNYGNNHPTTATIRVDSHHLGVGAERNHSALCVLEGVLERDPVARIRPMKRLAKWQCDKTRRKKKRFTPENMKEGTQGWLHACVYLANKMLIWQYKMLICNLRDVLGSSLSSALIGLTNAASEGTREHTPLRTRWLGFGTTTSHKTPRADAFAKINVNGNITATNHLPLRQQQ